MVYQRSHGEPVAADTACDCGSKRDVPVRQFLQWIAATRRCLRGKLLRDRQAPAVQIDGRAAHFFDESLCNSASDMFLAVVVDRT